MPMSRSSRSAQRDVRVAQDGELVARRGAPRTSSRFGSMAPGTPATPRGAAAAAARRAARASDARPRARPAGRRGRARGLPSLGAVERLEHGRARQAVRPVEFAGHVPAHVPEDSAEVEDDGAQANTWPWQHGPWSGSGGFRPGRCRRTAQPIRAASGSPRRAPSSCRARHAIALEVGHRVVDAGLVPLLLAAAAAQAARRAPRRGGGRPRHVRHDTMPPNAQHDHRRKPAEARVARRAGGALGAVAPRGRGARRGQARRGAPRPARPGGGRHRHRHRRRADAPALRLGLRRAARGHGLLEDGHDRHPRRPLQGRRPDGDGAAPRRGPIHADEVASPAPTRGARSSSPCPGR